MKDFIKVVILTGISICVIGCSAVYKKVVGIHEPSYLNSSQLDKSILKVKIPADNTFTIDNSFYAFYEKESKYHEQVSHDHLQPLQISVYNIEGKLISFHINCNTGGFLNLNWNKDGRFDTIPPGTAVDLDTTLNLSRHISMIRNYKTGQRLRDDPKEYDYYIIVHWCVFWKRQSKRLVKFIEKYKSKHPEYRIKIIYVNDDNMYAQK